jgi:hypothetical protein
MNCTAKDKANKFQADVGVLFEVTAQRSVGFWCSLLLAKSGSDPVLHAL